MKQQRRRCALIRCMLAWRSLALLSTPITSRAFLFLFYQPEVGRGLAAPPTPPTARLAWLSITAKRKKIPGPGGIFFRSKYIAEGRLRCTMAQSSGEQGESSKNPVVDIPTPEWFAKARVRCITDISEPRKTGIHVWRFNPRPSTRVSMFSCQRRNSDSCQIEICNV